MVPGEVSIDTRKVALWMAYVVAAIVATSVVLRLVKSALGHDPGGVAQLFRLNAENNIPSFWNAMLFVVGGMLFIVVWRVYHSDAGKARPWPILGLVFGFLAYDELYGVHESLSDPIENLLDLSGSLKVFWIFAYAGLVVVVALLFFPAWRSLGRRLRHLFAASAIVYLSGAVGFELLGEAVYSGREGDMIFGLMYTIEESLEMLGLVLVIYTLLETIRVRAPRSAISLTNGAHTRSNAPVPERAAPSEK